MSSLRLFSSNLKNGAKSSSLKSRWATRNVHHRRSLLYPLEEGLGNFLPPPALQTAVEWQDGLLERLNEEVKGTPEENTTIAQTVINTSAFKEKTLAFNYASLALNNSYFLDNLKPPPPIEDHQNFEHEIQRELGTAIEEQHGSLRQLKSSFSAAALGMFTNGWVWFVTDARGVTGILPTFGPGTLLVRSRSYMGVDKGLNLGDSFITPDSLPSSSVTPAAPTYRPSPPGTAPASPSSGVSSPTTPRTPDALHPRFMHTTPSLSQFNWRADSKSSIHGPPAEPNPEMSTPSILNVGEVIYPLFCVSVYEHNWMTAGYGVWGKEEWLKQFWSVLDWSKVNKAYKAARAAKNAIPDGL